MPEPLNVTKEAKHRIFCGLGWDPANPNLIEKIKDLTGLDKMHHDLDLTCFAFGADHRLIALVDADAEHNIDESGHIYHSGDDEEGHGPGDDEEISVELKDLPAAIQTLVFTARIKTKQSFTELNNPEIRLVDGYTNRNFLHRALNPPAEYESANSYIFCRIDRAGEDWTFTPLENYMHTDDRDTLQSRVQEQI